MGFLRLLVRSWTIVPMLWLPPMSENFRRAVFSGIGRERKELSSKIGLGHPPFSESKPFLLRIIFMLHSYKRNFEQNRIRLPAWCSAAHIDLASFFLMRRRID